MKTKLFAALFIAAAACWGTTIPCAGVSDITTITGSAVCTAGIDTYSNLSVGFYPTTTITAVTVGITATTPIDGIGNDDLTFSISTTPDPILTAGPKWIAIWFTMTASVPFNSVYLEVPSSDTGIFVEETICSSTSVANVGECSDASPLADIGAHPGYDASANFGQFVTSVNGVKFIQINDAHIDSLVNGFGSTAPEPGTLVMFGSAMIGLSIAVKRRSSK